MCIKLIYYAIVTTRLMGAMLWLTLREKYMKQK